MLLSTSFAEENKLWPATKREEARGLFNTECSTSELENWKKQALVVYIYLYI